MTRILISICSSLGFRFSKLSLAGVFATAIALAFAFACALSLASTHTAHAATTEVDPTGVQPKITRLAGQDAAETSLDIVKQTYSGETTTSSWVLIARDDDFADAMSATGLAGALGAPIILANRESGLTDAALEEIEALGAKNAYIIGGAGAIPADIESQLKTTGIDTKESSEEGIRIYGQAYYETSVACAAKIKETNEAAVKAGMATSTPNDVIVAMGINFQDALSISSFAYKYKLPIFLETDGGGSSDAAARVLTEDAIAAIKASIGTSGTIYVPGGPGALTTASVEGFFGAEKVIRIYGEDGYETSNEIAKWMVENGKLTAETCVIANGELAPRGTDALSGSALAGQAGGVVLLTNTNASVGTVDKTTLNGFLNFNSKAVKNAFVAGGKYVMPQSVIDKVKAILWKYKTVTFNTAGGSEVATQYIYAGDKLQKPEDPERYGYIFDGWYANEECSVENEFKFDNTGVSERSLWSDLALYAKWLDDDASAVTAEDGTATIKNPADSTSYKITVEAYTSTYPGEELSNAEVNFNGNGFLTVTTPSDADAKDILITVEKSADNTAVGDVAVTVNKSDGTAIASGSTTASKIEGALVEAGQYRAHNGGTWAIEPCVCTGTTKIKRCSVCPIITATETVTAKGHVDANGNSTLEPYGKNNVAQKCSQCNHVIFGEYEQDDNESNGKEAIEWIELPSQSGTPTEGDAVKTLISLQALDAVKWNNTSNNTWSSSYVRTWLNDSFYNTAFRTDIQKATIAETKLITYNYRSSEVLCETVDNVFLLSNEEAYKIHSYSNDKALLCIPTLYAISSAWNLNTVVTNNSTNACDWWLRSPAISSSYNKDLMIVDSLGLIGIGIDFVEIVDTVRPVINLYMQ